MVLRDVLIAAICHPQLFELHRQSSVPKDAKIMSASFAKRSADDHACEIIHDHLRFQWMPTLLATIPSLFFWGAQSGTQSHPPATGFPMHSAGIGANCSCVRSIDGKNGFVIVAISIRS
jgi:hypothetical protein